MRTAVALTSVIVLLVAGIVDAKVLWHVGGEVVDSRGVLVGRIATFGGTVPALGVLPASVPPEPGLPMVLLQVNDVTFPLFVTSGAFQAVTWLFFPTADCTGPGYVSNPGAMPFAQVAVHGLEVFTFDPAATNALITARSATRGGACVAATMDVQVVPAELLVDFTDRWVPSFAIR
jgi:hypothetical protein